jgi:protein phosphatase
VVQARLAAAAEAAGIWSELATDWVLLDAEIMPWSAKAGPLIEAQYAPVGEAARLGLSLAQQAMARTAARLPETAPLVDLFVARQERAARYDAAWRGYVWDAPRPEDLRVAPFHLLASEGTTHLDRPHDWHMGWNGRLAATGEPVLQATEWHRLDVSDEAACREIAAWWEAKTTAGGEGMVVKPMAFTVRDRKGRLIQPALKVRGRDYLRIIYGPDYDALENLVRLKERALDRKRNLALSEYALGHEALTRFVAGEPLRRWHDCVLGMLALESEPIDPRL